MEEKEHELRGAAPHLFGFAFTKQAADYLEQVETQQKPKEEEKGLFEASLVARQARWQGRSRPYGWAGMGHCQQLRGILGLTPEKLK